MQTSSPQQVVRVAKALSGEMRFRILQVIAKYSEIRCGELSAAIPEIQQATVSHHVRILTEAGLVQVREEGPYHFFRVNREALREHQTTLTHLFSETT